MKKILYYSDCPFFAGCENMLVNFFESEELAKEFDLKFIYHYSERYEEGARKRMDMSRSTPITLVPDSPKQSLEDVRGLSFSFFRTRFWFLSLWFRKYYSIKKNVEILSEEFRKYDPDILHINNGGFPAATSCYAAVLAARRCGINKVVYVVNNMAADYKHPLRWFDRRLDKIVKEQVTYFINGSDNAGNRLKDVLKLPAAKQLTIRNGIIPRKVTMERNEFRKLYGIDKDTFVFAEVANMEERKGHRILLNAVIKYKADNPSKKFMVLLEGNGPLKEEIASFIDENSLSGYVKMIAVDQIYNLYHAIDVLILPSIHTEDFPNTIIEAMGQGIPVIGTTIAGIPEQIDDHINGLLIKAGDVDALANAMTELSNDRNLYVFCQKNARCKFEKNYTADISVKNYMNLYHSMLNC